MRERGRRRGRAVAALTDGNADWMGSLPAPLRSLPLSNLAIPGSHDSFSYWVDEKSPVGPDQATAIKRLARISLVRKIMKKWSVTQNLTFKEQLEGGIRYFDLRVSSKPGEIGQEIYFIHGLFGIKVWDGLKEINTFLEQHPKEVIFLDFNHFYAMDDGHHHFLINRIHSAFESKLCAVECVEYVTLQYMWEKKHQFLETTLEERSRYGTFHVSQAILTPRVKTIARHLIRGLKNTLVHRNLPMILNWVKEQKPGVMGVNIITSDFVELVDFAATVIALNDLLLEEDESVSKS
ncbi:PI-PLC X domain-containing protein 2 [Willisornis vidua]|uniref:PI-PLC X domain-containing protein 2 n=1 Tax=Willisornis vidua TaxID=1566151 RepID=A0ABQ9DLD7_9PASS|nr:PI-PLC X domain-containing protein 2 [Willisornis vidua]